MARSRRRGIKWRRWRRRKRWGRMRGTRIKRKRKRGEEKEVEGRKRKIADEE